MMAENTKKDTMKTENTTTPHTQAAVDFLQLIVAGRIEEGYRKFVDMHGKHHNPYFPAGFPALQAAMTDDHEKFPDKKFTIHSVIGDGNTVAVHSHIVMDSGEKNFAVVHIFRFEHGRIVEMWDCAQSLPVDSPNADGAF
jgi:predicted SnoaL-like aldol condensation-catalyzing enzyme